MNNAGSTALAYVIGLGVMAAYALSVYLLQRHASARPRKLRAPEVPAQQKSGVFTEAKPRSGVRTS